MRQHMEALALANEVRLGRAQIKRELRTGEIPLSEAMVHPHISSMRTFDLLSAQRLWGKKRTHKVLSRAGVSAGRPVGDLTPGERRRLCEMKGR